MADDLRGWELLANTCEQTLADLRKRAAETRLSLDCVRATAPVFAKHGQRHPGEYGAGESLASLERRAAALEADVERWEECARLVREAVEPKPLTRYL